MVYLECSKGRLEEPPLRNDWERFKYWHHRKAELARSVSTNHSHDKLYNKVLLHTETVEITKILTLIHAEETPSSYGHKVGLRLKPYQGNSSGWNSRVEFAWLSGFSRKRSQDFPVAASNAKTSQTQPSLRLNQLSLRPPAQKQRE